MTIRLYGIYDIKERLLALIFVMAPFLQHYVMPVIGINTEYALVLFVGGAFAVLRALTMQKCEDRFIGKYIIIVMGIYVLLNHMVGDRYIYDTSVTKTVNIISFFLIMIICAVVFSDRKTRKYYFEYLENVAIIMALVVMFQVVIYYLFGNPITNDRSFLFPFKSMFSESVKYSLSKSEMVINGLFRPSAFFIEPAHYSQFCTLGLVCALLNGDKILNKRAIIISAGIILTTSGMGILSVFLMWAAFLYVNAEGLNRKRITRMVLGTILFVGIVIALFSFSDSFRSAIARVFIGSNGYDSAILGRTRNAVLIQQLSPIELTFGMGYKNIPTYGGELKIPYYMTGILELVYCQGVVGTSLFLLCYIHMMIKAYGSKQNLPLYVLMAYVPYLVGSSNIAMLTFIQYIPLLYVPKLIRCETRYEFLQGAYKGLGS